MQPLVILAVEHRVGNKSTRVDRVLSVALLDNSQWIAGSSAQIRHSSDSSRKLLGVNTLNIATMVLVKVGEAIVDKNGLLHCLWDGELDCALCCCPRCIETFLNRWHSPEGWGLK
jgi:hypothetical protein